MDFEARYVLDWTDHVWTEVYSSALKRWLHCDPCENTCDKPFTYEVGWNKKLSYIIAFSKDEVVDVTWRYSCHHKDVLSRRLECRESWLVQTLSNMNKTMQKSLRADIRQMLQERMIIELCEFLSEKKPGEGEHSGRQSGSAAWRSARGEIGSTDVAQTSLKPTEEEKQLGLIHLQYSSVDNCYTRGHERIPGWQNLVFEAENIARKEEMDWKMVYLARSEGSSSAKIAWKVDLLGEQVFIFCSCVSRYHSRIWICAGQIRNQQLDHQHL
jgi:peptide-N4-(N-acetyl-beta-glucosaminyl)asparagine amidase